MATTRFSGRTFNIPRIALPATGGAEAAVAEARAFLSSREARQMSVSDFERELHRRRQELVRQLLQEHREQRSPTEAPGPVEGAGATRVEDAGGVECTERREDERRTETASPTVKVPHLGCAPCGPDGLHPPDAARNLMRARYCVEVRRRTRVPEALHGAVHELLPRPCDRGAHAAFGPGHGAFAGFNSRSNSANAAVKMPNKGRPTAVVVSICTPSRRASAAHAADGRVVHTCSHMRGDIGVIS